MMTNHHTLAPRKADELKRFVKRAEKLVTSTFWGWLTRRRGASDMAKVVAGDWLAHDGLNVDEFDAFCLNLRFFLQDKDGFSIRKVKDIASEWPEQHADLRNEIYGAIQTLKGHLDASCLVRISDDKPTTNRELFDVVFYGGVVHENEGKREEFDRIINSGPFAYFVFQAFTGIMFYYRNCILAVGFHVEKYLLREGLIPESK